LRSLAIAPFSELIEQNHSLGNDAPRSSKYDGLLRTRDEA
jgi:hypothetical protein